MKARDIMMPIYDYLKPDNSLREAVNILRNAARGKQQTGVPGLPVLDGTSRLAGILSMRDILRAVYPSYMSMMNLGEFTWDGMLESLAKEAGRRSVKEFMTSPVVTVHEDHPLMECVDHMLKHNIRMMPVVDAAGTVVGMIYIREIFYAVTKAMLAGEAGGAK